MGEKENASRRSETVSAVPSTEAQTRILAFRLLLCGVSGAVGERRAAALDRRLHFQQSVQSGTHICRHVAGMAAFSGTQVRTLCETFTESLRLVSRPRDWARHCCFLVRSAGLSEVLEPYLVVLNGLAQIRPGAASDRLASVQI
ncbi:MAG: hypothetical protein ACLTSZ_17235 [Lachnospiraceae bacterium]